MADFPIHFFTLVLNGQPFIRYHLQRFQALQCPWHWHIIEGLAELKHDTAWSLQFGAQLPADVAKAGRSVDGTAEYLDEIARENPGRITVYRAPNGRTWDGKLEMVNAPLPHLPAECLLWEVDSDELWTTAQLERMREMFLAQPQRTAAVFYCWFFVAPNLAINRRRRYQEIEWRRAWRYRAGMKWLAHEPPILGVPVPGTTQFADVTMRKPFTPVELEQAGLVFQHFAYVTEAQLAFKEKYYGYQGITAEWRRLRAEKDFPVALKNYFKWPWVHPQAMVDPADSCGIVPLAHVDAARGGGGWVMEPAQDSWEESTRGTGTPAKRGVLYMVWNGAGGNREAMLRRSIASVRTVHPELPIYVQRLPEGATVLDKAAMAARSPFEETLYLDADTVVLDRLDFGFDMALKHGLACTISDCPWARRYGGLKGDAVAYDTGVIFFTGRARGIFDAWQAKARTVPSSYRAVDGRGQLGVVGQSDHAAFSLALAESAAPAFMLPFNWNFRPRTHRTWWGPVKVWHDQTDVPPGLAALTRDQANPETVLRYLKFGG